MTIPQCTITITDIAALIGVTDTPLAGTDVWFFPNILEGDLIRFESTLYRVEPVQGVIDEYGELRDLEGNTGVNLLANDPSLDLVDPLQWRVQFRNATINGFDKKVNDWWFTAPDNGVLVDLSALNHVTGMPATGAATTTVYERATQWRGSYDASTNTPELSDGGDFTAGDTYQVAVPGTRNFGSASLTLMAGDTLIYSGTEWQQFAATSMSAPVWSTITGKPAVIAAGSTQAIARAAISAETTSAKNASNGYAGLNSSAKLPLTTLAASGTPAAGNWLRGDGTWAALPGSAVTSVAGRTGAVTLTATDITNSTTLGRSLVTASSQNSARIALGPQVYDARDFGVIADGAMHPNNTANLLDCFAQAAAAGADVLLPAGVIDTSDAVAGTTVTADSGNTYVINGGIPLPMNTPMTIMGHGMGVTTLKLSPSFRRGFDFRDIGASDQRYSRITIRGITFDRQNIIGTTVAPLTSVTSNVTLTAGVWVTLPGVSATTFKHTNGRSVWFDASNTGTAKNMAIDCRIVGSEFQVRAQSTKTLVAGDKVQGWTWDHVILGNLNGANQSMDSIHVEDCEAINVATTTDNGMSMGKDTAWGIYIDMRNTNNIVDSATNVTFRNVRIYGGNTGILVTGSNNCFIDEVWCYDCYHDTQINHADAAILPWVSANYQLGGNAWTNRCGLVRCVGKRSGDVGIEIDGAWDAQIQSCSLENSFTCSILNTSFTVPARTAAGPAATTLNNGGTVSSSATMCTVSSIPSGVPRAGLALIDSELVWYQVTNTAGTSWKIWRGINGSSAASHADSTKVTFVPVDEPRYTIRDTMIRNAPLPGMQSNRAIMAWTNAYLPMTPMTVRDVHVDIIGGDYIMGQAMMWIGWMPDMDIQGLRVTQQSLNYTTASGSRGSMISSETSSTSALYSTSVPCRPPRVYGRNNIVKVHGTSSNAGGPVYCGFNPQTGGYAQIDLDLDIEIGLSGNTNGSGSRCVLLAPMSGVMVIAPNSRLGITGMIPSVAGDPGPYGFQVASTSTVTIVGVLDVDLNFDGMTFWPSAGDGNYVPWIIDSTQKGKVRFGKIRHAAAATGNWPTRKSLAVTVTSPSYTVGADEELLLVDTASNAVAITLPLAKSSGSDSIRGEPLTRGRKIQIVDAGFNAATNNITITPQSTEKIDNGTTGSAITLNTNGSQRTVIAYAAMPGWISDSNR